MHELDYAALSESLTKADIATYKQSGAQDTAFFKTISKGSIAYLVLIALVSIGAGKGKPQSLLLPLMIIVPALVIYWFSFRNTIAYHARLFKFATRNDLKTMFDIAEPGYPGVIFNHGDSPRINEALRFKNGIEIGNYTYVTGSGKNRRSHPWGYVRIKLARRLPHMILDAKANDFWKISNLEGSFDRSQRLALEGDFNNYFTLYAPKQYERDALYVFTPDVMAVMIDSGKWYDMEIVDDELFMYTNGYFQLDKPYFYEPILKIIAAISSELTRQTEYYADERVGERAVNVVAPEGQRLKAGINWLVVAGIAVFVYFMIIQPLLLRQ